LFIEYAPSNSKLVVVHSIIRFYVVKLKDRSSHVAGEWIMEAGSIPRHLNHPQQWGPI